MQPEGKILLNLTGGKIVCDRLTIAQKPRQRMRGLLGRSSLSAGEGMLLQPAPSIHTAFMRFDIDVVFLDGTLQVKRIVEALAPWRMAAERGAWAVLEVAAGAAASARLAVGDQLGVVDISDPIASMLCDLRSGEKKRGELRLDPVARMPVADEVATAALSSPPPGERSGRSGTGEALRVLVVGKDRRFRAVTAALLTRRGCSVYLGDRLEPGAVPAGDAAVDVVVVDLSTSDDGIEAFRHTLEEGRPEAGIVLVGDGADHLPLGVLPKWGEFDVLYGAIRSARDAWGVRA